MTSSAGALDCQQARVWCSCGGWPRHAEPSVGIIYDMLLDLSHGCEAVPRHSRGCCLRRGRPWPTCQIAWARSST